MQISDKTGLIGLSTVLKLWIGRHHCVALIEMIKTNMRNIRFENIIWKLRFREILHAYPIAT
jgi:hypothetical protein